MTLYFLLAGCGQNTSDEEEARAACKARYDNIQRWMNAHGRTPGTDDELAAAAKRADKDPWGNDYVIEQSGAEIVVWSAGPDGRQETEDDISYPPVR